MERDYKVVCDRSGMVFLRSECRMTWDNKLVAIKYWEPRQTQDIIRPRNDDQTIPIAKPGPQDPARGTPMYYNQVLAYNTLCTYVGVAGFDVSMAI